MIVIFWFHHWYFMGPFNRWFYTLDCRFGLRFATCIATTNKQVDKSGKTDASHHLENKAAQDVCYRPSHEPQHQELDENAYHRVIDLRTWRRNGQKGRRGMVSASVGHLLYWTRQKHIRSFFSSLQSLVGAKMRIGWQSKIHHTQDRKGL